MRKFIKISIAVLSIIFLILLGAWLVSRQKAIEEGRIPLTFREFLNLSSDRDSKSLIGNNNGELTSDFQDPNGNGSNSSGSTNNGAPDGSVEEASTRVSKFTNNTSIPNIEGATDIGSVSGVDTNGDGVINGDDQIDAEYDDRYDPAKAAVLSAQTQPECSDRDLNIQFTQDELNKLQALQARFYAVSQDLHNDSDVNSEKQNWSTFKAESAKITEFYNYCAGTNYDGVGYQVTNPLLKFRLPTPFWHDERAISKDTNTILPADLNALKVGGVESGNYYTNSSGIVLGLSEDDILNVLNKIFNESGANDRAHKLEKTLRLNLW